MKKYKHHLEPTLDCEPCIAGSSSEDQTQLCGNTNRWIELARNNQESDDEYQKRRAEDKKVMESFRSHLLVLKTYDTGSGRLCAVATKEKRIGYSWMPVLENAKDNELVFQVAGALAIQFNCSLGRSWMRKNTGRKMSWPQFNPVAFYGIPLPDIDNPDTLQTLFACYQETCEEIVPQFRDGRTPIRETWDDAVALACGIDRNLIAECAELLARDAFVSKERFYEHQ